MAIFEDILVIFVGKSSKTYHIEDLTGNFVGKSSNTVHFRDLNRGGEGLDDICLECHKRPENRHFSWPSFGNQTCLECKILPQ